MIKCLRCGSLDVKFSPALPDWYDGDILDVSSDFVCPNCGRIDDVVTVFENGEKEDD